MKGEQVNLRLEADLVAAIEFVARSECVERGTVVRKFLRESLQRWKVARALNDHRLGNISLERAAEEAGVPLREMLELRRQAGISPPEDPGELEAQLRTIREWTTQKPPRTRGALRKTTKSA